jgi:hypothetical protein
MGEKMTLERVRDWHLEEARRLNKSQHPFPNNSTVLLLLSDYHQTMADAIDAYLATPAQTVDVEAVREVISTLERIGEWECSDKLSQAIGDKT